jgi:hypothetical protein
MKPHQVVAIALLFPAVLLLHAKDKKPKVPAVFGQAKYIYVEAVDGEEFDPNIDPEDKLAIADVRDALDNWKRYILTSGRIDADVVIVVRKGRAAGKTVVVTPRRGPLTGGAGQPAEIGEGSQIGRDEDDPDDTLEVCTVDPNGKLSNPLWQRSMPGGLRAPRMPLLEQFEEAVDKAYPPQAAPQKASQQPARQQPVAPKP